MMFISKLSGIILPSGVYTAFIEKEYMQGESLYRFLIFIIIIVYPYQITIFRYTKFSAVMNLDELWIGDWVKIVNKNVKGKFDGKGPDGQAKIKNGKEIFLVKASDIIKIPDEQVNELHTQDSDINHSSLTLTKAVSFKNVIDLHIEKLDPHMINSLPGRILKVQVEKCMAYIEQAIELNIPIVTIIHGKGTGLLKAEVEHILHMNKKHVRFTFVKNNGGALEVWLQ